MSIAQERLAFAPPPTPGLVRALLLAILAHGLLLALLTAGVQWRRETPPVTAEAELWSAIPELAAPPAPLEPPPPEPEPVKPPPAVEPPPVPKPDPAPDIAIAKEKARLQKEKLKQEKADQEEKKLAKLEQEKKDKAKQDKLDKAKQAKLDKLASDKKLLAEKKLQTEKSSADAKKLEELRQQNLKRMAGLAGAAVGNGDANSTGSAAQASGPSAGYAGRIRARIKPNITYTETISGNPIAEVEVRTSPSGTIISRRLTQSSGVKSWDDAVLNAIDKTEVLPRDVDGRVPTSLVISFRPRD